jgi:carboxypeptidase Taq
MEAYKKLEGVFEKAYRFQHFVELGDWDAAVMMPSCGAEARGEAMAVLKNHIHQMYSSQEVQSMIAEAATAQGEMTDVERANFREMQRIVKEETMFSDEFVQRKAKVTNMAQRVWAKAKAANDFAMFLPFFKKTVEVAREEGRLRAGNSGATPYAGLLAFNEPGLTVEKLEEIFNDIKSWLPQLIREVQENRKDIDASMVPLQTPIPIAQQAAMGRLFAQVWGYDPEGRLDIAPHPFSGMVKEDSRITTHYSEDNYEKSVFATIHETGHSRYETGCGPREKLGQPVCMARSAGIHESQSRFGEVIIGRSGAFAEFMTPYLKQYLGDQPAFTVENVRKLNQVVKPGFIRVAADEVCYPMHVIMRFEIERALIDGEMEPEQVPQAWAEKVKEYFGLDTCGRDDIGCLQDTHWSGCGFGGFPGYSIGSIFAAQLMATIKKEIGEDTVTKCIRNGDMKPILEKQREKVWSIGCLYPTMMDVVVKATGEPLSTKYFREHLERRYLRNQD